MQTMKASLDKIMEEGVISESTYHRVLENYV